MAYQPKVLLRDEGIVYASWKQEGKTTAMSAHRILGLKQVPRVWLFANESGTRAGFKPSQDRLDPICRRRGNLRKVLPSTRGPEGIDLWCTSCSVSGALLGSYVELVISAESI